MVAPAWGAWIEIADGLKIFDVMDSVAPCMGSGLKFAAFFLFDSSRSLHGERGLKYAELEFNSR